MCKLWGIFHLSFVISHLENALPVRNEGCSESRRSISWTSESLFSSGHERLSPRRSKTLPSWRYNSFRGNPLRFPRYRGTETHKMIILSQTKHLTIDSLFYAENGFLRQFYVKELNDFKFCRMSYHKVIEEIWAADDESSLLISDEQRTSKEQSSLIRKIFSSICFLGFSALAGFFWFLL